MGFTATSNGQKTNPLRAMMSRAYKFLVPLLKPRARGRWRSVVFVQAKVPLSVHHLGLKDGWPKQTDAKVVDKVRLYSY